MADHWFEEQFAKLQIDGNRYDGLAEIHGKLQALNPDEIQSVFSSGSVRKIFGCVEKGTSQQTTVACDILSLCLSSLDLNRDKDDVLLFDMIRHVNEDVKIIGLTQLERRLLKKQPEYEQSQSSVVYDVIKCLELQSTEIGALSIRVLKLLLPHHSDSFSQVRAALESAGSSSSTSKCRVYEVVVNFSLTGPQNMRRFEGILQGMIVDQSSEDILLQLNIMELLSELVATEYGLEYLEEQGLFPRLMAALENIDKMMILFPGFIKFFGSVANAHPDKIFTKFSHICKPLFETIIANDSSTLSPCLETLGVLGRSKQGKIGLSCLHLVCPEGDMKMVLMEMAMFLTTLPTEEQIRILNCLELLFRHEPEGHESTPDNRICSITESWYTHLDRGPGLKTLLGYLRNPFPDIKLAGLGVLKSVVDYPWGRAAVAETAGLLEYILDRSADFNTEAFRAKFEVLNVLNRHNDGFSEAQQNDIKNYVARGPFYKKGITEVAVEGGQ